MIRREFDPDKVNAFLNEGEDATVLLNDSRNICLLDEGGGAMFAWRGPRIYEGHTFFNLRGRAAIDLGTQILEQMTEFADLIWGATPVGLRHVRWFNRKIGFRSLGLMEAPEGTCELFEKRY